VANVSTVEMLARFQTCLIGGAFLVFVMLPSIGNRKKKKKKTKQTFFLNFKKETWKFWDERLLKNWCQK